jgi:hypothetical protein
MGSRGLRSACGLDNVHPDISGARFGVGYLIRLGFESILWWLGHVVTLIILAFVHVSSVD